MHTGRVRVKTHLPNMSHDNGHSVQIFCPSTFLVVQYVYLHDRDTVMKL